MPAVPPPRRLARGSGPDRPRVLLRSGVLGPRRSGFRRPARVADRRRLGAGSARGQPDGPDVHRRPIGGLALRGAAPGRLRVTAHQHLARGRPHPSRRVHHCGRPLRAPANKPDPAERAACAPYLARELALLRNAAVVVALGQFAWQAAAAQYGLRPRPAFGHLAESPLPSGATLLGSYHPSQQNTFTGKLTVPMFDAVFRRASRLIADAPGRTAQETRSYNSR